MIRSAEEFLALRQSEDPAEYRRAANEPAPLEVWQEVVETYREMRRWVTHNKTVPIEVLEVLARDPDEHVRWTVATKRKLTDAVFEVLAADGDESVRARIARNANAPTAVLERLATDASESIRTTARDELERRRGSTCRP